MVFDRKEYQKEYREKPENKLRAKGYKKVYMKEWREKLENKLRAKEYMKEYGKKYYQTPEYKTRKKEYSQRPKVRKRKREYTKIHEKLRRKMDLNYVLTRKLRTRLWKVLKKYTQSGKINKSQGYGIDYKAIIEHLKPFPENIKEFHIDHIIPLSLFDFNNSKHIKKAFLPENHQWLTIKQNLEKNNKLIMPCAFK